MPDKDPGGVGGSSLEPVSSTRRPEKGLVAFLRNRPPLRLLILWVAGIRASVQTKLLCAFLLVSLLIIVTGAMSLQALRTMNHQSQLLDQAQERESRARQIQQSFTQQMNFTAMALIIKDEATVQKILRENNRFNRQLAILEEAVLSERSVAGELIQLIRTHQEEVMTIMADIADHIRDSRFDEARHLQLTKVYPLFEQIESLVAQVLNTEEKEKERLRQSVTESNRRTLVFVSIIAAVAFLLALVLGFVISWSFILPVREADVFLGHVAEGRFDRSIQVPNRDEFGALAYRMNRMSQELDRLNTEQRESAKQLQRINEQLQAASKAKSEFLANMSHELRTPLNAILGFIELMQDEIYGEVPLYLKEPLSDVQNNGRHLLRLINDILDVSKIEAGRMELRLEKYLVEDIISSARASLQSLAGQKGLGFVSGAENGIPPAFGDGGRITQCLINIAGNALKFTETGRVEISVELKDEMLTYKVKDTGIGIPQDKIEKVFDEFHQGDATITRDFGGTGLGLSITKKFVEMHGGRIWVESEQGKGSSFYFTIPLIAAQKGKV
jgi:signal transduction histidine kinase